MINYFCQGCKFLNKNTLCELKEGILHCSECNISNISSIRNTFSNHSKSGVCCRSCNRFIPYPLNNNINISCPYTDCLFVGALKGLKFTSYPDKQYVDDFFFNKSESYKKIELAIEEIISYYTYVSNIDFTRYHKISVLESFSFFLKYNTSETINYLVNGKRGLGIQNKIYKKYVSILENKLPLSFKKNDERFYVKDIFDSNLGIFSGISIFDEVIKDNSVKNNTKEIYIGSRSSYYVKPYYIGKLVDVIDLDTKESLMCKVKDYNFNKIFFEDGLNGKKVNISHLMTVPHYQAGGMSYVNRIKTEICDIVRVT